MRKPIVFTVIVVGTLLTAVTAASAQKVKADFNGLGTHVIVSDGSAALAGDVTGEPFDGPYEALLPADGTHSDPSPECVSPRLRRFVSRAFVIASSSSPRLAPSAGGTCSRPSS
jgi:hypothetical protein